MQNKKYDLSALTEEEKDQLKDYANAIKETRNAMLEILSKASTTMREKKEKGIGKWGGPRKNMIMPLSEKKSK